MLALNLTESRGEVESLVKKIVAEAEETKNMATDQKDLQRAREMLAPPMAVNAAGLSSSGLDLSLVDHIRILSEAAGRQ